MLNGLGVICTKEVYYIPLPSGFLNYDIVHLPDDQYFSGN